MSGSSFFGKRRLQQIVDHSLGRVLDLFDIGTDIVQRWTGHRADLAGAEDETA